MFTRGMRLPHLSHSAAKTASCPAPAKRHRFDARRLLFEPLESRLVLSSVSDGLIGYWPFDGDGADLSGNARDVELIGGVGFAEGLFGQALDLQGNGGQFAQQPVDDEVFDFGGGDFTMQTWVNFSDTSGVQTLIEKFDGPIGPGWTLEAQGDRLQFYASPSEVLTSASLPVVIGAWHQIVARKEGTRFSLLFDGLEVAGGIDVDPVPDTAFGLLIGRRQGTQSNAVNGRMDEVAIWNRSLDDTEVAALYNNGAGVSMGFCQSCADTYQVDEDTVLSADAAGGVLANDGDLIAEQLAAELQSGAQFGQVSLEVDGSFEYTPEGDYFGADSFVYVVTDAQNQQRRVEVTITVSPVNDAPVAIDDRYVTGEGQSLSVDRASDDDGELNNRTFFSRGSTWRYFDQVANSADYPSDGAGNLWNEPQFADAAWSSGPALLGYGTIDAGPISTTLDFGLDSVNKRLTYLFRRTFELEPDATVESLSFDFLIDDGAAYYINGQEVFRSNISGSVGDPIFTFSTASAPGDENNYQTQTVNLTGRDDLFVVGTNTIAVELHQINAASSDIGFDLGLSASLRLTPGAAGVLANDVDVEDDPLTAVLVTPPSSGSLVFQTDGTFDYTPDAGFSGIDSFSYRPSDDLLGGNTAVATLIVIPAGNTPPAAVGDSYQTDEDTRLVILATLGLLDNDSDAQLDPITATLAEGPSDGNVILASDGSFEYTPNPDFVGTDTFTYLANDRFEDSLPATVTITVSPINDPPIAQDDQYSVVSGQTLVVEKLDPGAGEPQDRLLFDRGASWRYFDQLPEIAAYPRDDSERLWNEPAFDDSSWPAGPALLGFGTIDGANIATTLDAGSSLDRQITYLFRRTFELQASRVVDRLAFDFLNDDGAAYYINGVEVFRANMSGQVGDPLFPNTLTVNGGNETSYQTIGVDMSGRQDLFVAGTNTIAVEVHQSSTTSSDIGFDLSLTATVRQVPGNPDLLANDSDIENDPLAVQLVTLPSNGSLTSNADGTFVYTPDAGFVGQDSFLYRASDGQLSSGPATVTINVTAAAADDQYAVDEDNTLSVDVAEGVLDNDADGVSLTATVADGPARGVLVLLADGSFEYTPEPDFFGVDTFTYTASDGITTSVPATVTITVNPINDAPLAADDLYNLAGGGRLAIGGSAMSSFGFADFSSTEGLNLVGIATTAATVGNQMRLASSSGGVGGVWFNTKRTVADGFDTTFEFQITELIGGGADGFAFVIQNSSDIALGDVAGRGIGYRGISNSLAVEFDTWRNPDVGDPNDNHVSVHTAGTGPNSELESFSLGLANPSFLLEDGNVHTVRIRYQGGNLAIFFNGSASPLLTVSVDLASTLNLDEGRAWVGLTAASGGSKENFDILSWSFTSQEPLPPGVLDNDTDADGDVLSATLVTSPQSGSLSLNADGSFEYTPNAGFVGRDSFTYRASDGSLSSDPATVTINVFPNAMDDQYAIDEDGILTADASEGVLDNDADLAVVTLTAALVEGPANGTLLLFGDGSFEYTPEADFFGVDTFTYTASDDISTSAPATVTITVNSVNDAPLAVDDAYEIETGSTLTVDGTPAPIDPNLLPPGVVQWRAEDGGNDSYYLAVVSGNTNWANANVGAQALGGHLATITSAAENNFVFALFDGPQYFGSLNAGPWLGALQPAGSPEPGGNWQWVTGEPFTYLGWSSSEPNNGGGSEDRIHFAGPNAPVWNDVGGSFTDPAAYVVEWSANLTTIPNFATPIPAGSVWKYLDDGSNQGTAWREPDFDDGAWVSGPAQLGYGDGDEATVVGFGPNLNDKFITTYFRNEFQVDDPSRVMGMILGLLRDDGGAVYLNGVEVARENLISNPGYQTPAEAPVGDSNEDQFFQFQVDPALLAEGRNVIAVEIHQANGSSSDISFDLSLEMSLSTQPLAVGVLANDSDVEGDLLTAQLVTPPSDGSLTFNADGTFEYTPDDGFVGQDSFTYRAHDGDLGGEPAVVTISVTPIAIDDSYAIDEDGILTISLGEGVLGNDGSTLLTAAVVDGPGNGLLSLAADGSFVYTPAADFFGVDTFTYTASFGLSTSAPATVTITVGPVNDVPNAVDDGYSIELGQTLQAVAGGTGTPTTVNQTSVAAGSVWKYLDDGSDQGSAWRASDFDDASWSQGPALLGYGDGDEATVVSFGPDGNNKFITAYFRREFQIEDTALVASLDLGLLRDDGAAVYLNGIEVVRDNLLSAAGYDELASGIALGGDESTFFPFSIDPSLLAEGRNVLAVEVHQASSISSDLRFDLRLDATFEFPPEWPGVLANDIDADGDTLTATLDLGPAGGSLIFNTDGTFEYTPNPGFLGVDTFTYTASDAVVESLSATVSITVIAGPNTPPETFDDAYQTDEDTPLSVPASEGLLANDIDFQADSLTVALVDGPSQGSLVLSGDGAFEYTPGLNYNGSDSFTYLANDGQFDSPPATVSITITPVSDPPVAAADTYIVTPGTALIIAAPEGVLGNDEDADGDLLTAAIVDQPSGGAMILSEDGAFIYIALAGFHGADAFTYRASDGLFESNLATVSIIVDNPPTAADDQYTIDEDQSLRIPVAAGLLDNDTDFDDDPLSAILVASPSSGLLSLAEDGSFEFAPAENFFGQVSFTYHASDGWLDSQPANVTITVRPVTDLPVATADEYLGESGKPLVVAVAEGVLSNDADPDGGPLAAELAGAPASGSVQLSGDGSFVYTPQSGFNGIVTFAYRAVSASGQSDVTTVSLTIAPSPEAFEDNYQLDEDTLLSVPAVAGVLANDNGPAGNPLSAVIVDGPASGLLQLADDGSFSYTPAADFWGSDSFTYRATAGTLTSLPATVTINVSPVNDTPVADDDSYRAAEGHTLVVEPAAGLLGNDTDADGDRLIAQLETGPANGTLTLDADGGFTYTPEAGFGGEDQFTYRASDTSLSSAAATVTILVSNSELNRSVVISEIMYHPSSDESRDEFIELFNRSDVPISLDAWRVSRGVDFDFPNVLIGPGEYLVIAADLDRFTATYGPAVNLIGPWQGRLSDSGEDIEIEDAEGERVDLVTYADQGDWAVRRLVSGDWRWIAESDGGGKSLELINPQLPNRRGHNWAASVPTGGTPGAANSVFSPDIAPMIRGVKHFPALPGPADEVFVTAELIDELSSGISASVFYRDATAAAGLFTELAMADDGLHGDGGADDGTWGATLPARPVGTIIEFYVSTSDEGGLMRSWPAASDDAGNQLANVQYLVVPPPPEGQPFYQLVFTADELTRFDNTSRGSNDQMNATFISSADGETKIRYNVGVRYRGSGSRGRIPANIRVNFPKDRSWNGVTAINLNTQYVFSQTVGMTLFSAAGLPTEDSRVVQVRTNSENRANQDSSKTFGSYVQLEVPDSDFAENHFPGDSAGNIYKGISGPLEYDSSERASFYASRYSKETNRAEADYSDIIALTRALDPSATPDSVFVETLEQIVDVNQWLRFFAVNALLVNDENGLINGRGDDYALYAGIVDPRFVLLPHDMDTVLNQGDTQRNLWSRDLFEISNNDRIQRIVEHPKYRPLYFAQLKQLAETVFAPEQLGPLLDRLLGGWVSASTIDDMKQFAEQRRGYVLSQIPAGTPELLGPQRNLRISEIMYNPNDGEQHEFIELTNTGTSPINLQGVRFTDGITFTFADIDLAAGEYIVVVKDIGAFETRYGTGINIAGEYSGRLNNGGERITLMQSTPLVETILDFSFDDQWQPATDGDGRSLVIADLSVDPVQWNDAASWQASARANGSPGEAEPLEVQPPSVVDVVVRGSEWSSAFVDYLEAQGLGSDGYSILSSDGRLPFLQISQISIRFDEDVNVSKADLSLIGLSVPQYELPAFSYDATANVATWLLAEPIAADRLLLQLSDDVTDRLGNRLDGDGDLAAGGVLSRQFDSLPGDVSGDGYVNLPDLLSVRRRLAAAVGDPAYRAAADVDGSGTIDSSDFTEVLQRQFNSLPIGYPGGNIAGDANFDGQVNLLDLARLRRNFPTATGGQASQGDVNGDGAINRIDIAQLGQFINRTANGSPAPESRPASASALQQVPASGLWSSDGQRQSRLESGRMASSVARRPKHRHVRGASGPIQPDAADAAFDQLFWFFMNMSG